MTPEEEYNASFGIDGAHRRPLVGFPWLDTFSAVVPQWLGVVPKPLPKTVNVYGPENWLAMLPQGHTSPWDPIVAVQRSAYNTASDGQSRGANTLMHELTHFYQQQRPLDTNRSLGAAMVAKFPTLTVGSNYPTTAPGHEREADLIAAMFQSLLKAKEENDFQESIGLRPH